MPSLSFDKTKGAKPIAVVKGGDYDHEVLYIHDDDHKGKKPKSDIDAKKYATEMRDIPSKERVQMLSRLGDAKKKGLTAEQLIGETAFAKSLYDRIITDEAKDTSINLPDDSTFQVLPSPDPEKREVFYIAGASGSGKSYMAKGIAECYKKLHPSREVYLISKLGDDSTLDTMKPPPKRINIQTLIDDYPELDEFKDCCVIFDDYDTFTGNAEKVIHKLIDGSSFIYSFWYAYARGSLHHGADDRAHGYRDLPYVHDHAHESHSYVYAHANVRGHVYAYDRGCVPHHHGRGHARGHGCADVHVNACAHAFLS